MRLKFKDKAIVGLVAAIPSKELLFDDEMENYEFSIETSMKLKKTMGYHAHRVFEAPLTVSDLATQVIEGMVERGEIQKDEIDALVLVTETPDQPMPPTSNIIQGKLGLKEDMICLDINQGCAGFEIGLLQSFMLLEQESIRKVVLVNAEMLSRHTSKRDRNSYPLIGDALAVTVLERKPGAGEIFANVKMDGGGAFAIQIPAGGLKMPCSEETRKEERDSFGNWRSAENLVMKGDEVFMFVQKRVPGLIEDVLDFAGKSKEEIECFPFHQPNKFMLTKLASKLKIPKEKMPSNIVENFGNSSSATVPLNMVYNLREELLKRNMLLCVAGFGVGLVWSSIVMNVGPLEFCRLQEI